MIPFISGFVVGAFVMLLVIAISGANGKDESQSDN